MHLSWKQFLLLSCVATLLVDSTVAVQHQACYGNLDSQSCSQHNLRCYEGSSIFFTQAVRGFKLISRNCYTQRPRCQNEWECCRNYSNEDCAEPYSQDAFTALAGECWNKRTCAYSVQEAKKENCGNKYESESGYSKVEYLCLSEIHKFTDSETFTASSLVLRFLPDDTPGSYACLVEGYYVSSRKASVLLAKSGNNCSRGCSSLKVDDESWLSCPQPRYATYTLTTPFTVRLHVVNENDNDEAWAVIDAVYSWTLRVKCEKETNDVSTPQCPSTSTAITREITSPMPTTQTTDSTTRPDTSVATATTRTDTSVATVTTRPDTPVPTAFPSSGGTGAGASSGSTAAHVQTSSASTLAAVSSTGVTKGSLPQSAENFSNTAAVVGGVVGAVVLVVAVVVVVFFLKRRSPTGKTSNTVAWFKGGNSKRSHGKSGGAEPHVTYAQPTSLPVYDNSAVTITDEAGVRDADGDYNRLGQKPTSSVSRDVTYGHLADGNDVTDYDYDHVTRGKPAARSGDVINNVYDTAGPATGGSTDEDFYDTTGAAKNRSDVINNVYTTAGPATGGSSTEDFYNTTVGSKNRPDVINNVYNSPEAEYYNTAGLRQLGRDVINIYDIPKSASAPGPGEGDDVTDADASSPYEFARAVK